MELQQAFPLLQQNVAGSVQWQVPLAGLTTFAIGGPASILVEAASADDIVTTLALCRQESLPLFILGAGSNVVVPDSGVAGVVLRTVPGLNRLERQGDTIVAGAGVTDAALSEFALSCNATGYEWIYDIPGSVGGAVYMNAGNNDGEMSVVVEEVDWLDSMGKRHTTPLSQLQFGYRNSRFHLEPGIVVECRMRIPGTDSPEAIRSKMEAIRDLRHSKFPADLLCAGSVFKRPAGHYAGRLIEQSGCGGLTVGGAQVSNKHKGFIVNTGPATSQDVMELISQVQERVLKHSGVALEPEVQLFTNHPFPLK